MRLFQILRDSSFAFLLAFCAPTPYFHSLRPALLLENEQAKDLISSRLVSQTQGFFNRLLCLLLLTPGSSAAVTSSPFSVGAATAVVSPGARNSCTLCPGPQVFMSGCTPGALEWSPSSFLRWWRRRKYHKRKAKAARPTNSTTSITNQRAWVSTLFRYSYQSTARRIHYKPVDLPAFVLLGSIGVLSDTAHGPSACRGWSISCGGGGRACCGLSIWIAVRTCNCTSRRAESCEPGLEGGCVSCGTCWAYTLWCWSFQRCEISGLAEAGVVSCLVRDHSSTVDLVSAFQIELLEPDVEELELTYPLGGGTQACCACTRMAHCWAQAGRLDAMRVTGC